MEKPKRTYTLKEYNGREQGRAAPCFTLLRFEDDHGNEVPEAEATYVKAEGAKGVHRISNVELSPITNI